jgi:predicted Fe-S protein YdhL (DUF1289 family)
MVRGDSTIARAMPVSSPCTKVCTIDPRSGLCHGCGRTLAEIAQWASLSESERQAIMAELPQRLLRKRRCAAACSGSCCC